MAGPALAFLLTRFFCHALDAQRRDERLHGRETGRIVMDPEGGYTVEQFIQARRRYQTALRPGSAA